MEDFRDLLIELVKAKARFLIVGAHALGVHGVPRATVDIYEKMDKFLKLPSGELATLAEHQRACYWLPSNE